MKLLHCEINKQSKEPWPSRLVRPQEKLNHPIQHLLLIQFLGYTAKDFFQISEEFKPFGEGALPCLNPVCENFQQFKKDSYSRKEMMESESYKQDRLELYKQKWLAVKKANPTAGRRSLKRRFAALHSWLKRHDPEWLEANMPARQKMTQPKQPSRVDWESLDTEFVAALRASASRIKNAPGRPVRITKSLLGQDIGKSSQIRDHLDKLPLTYQALAELVETYEEFAIRKVEWAAECFRQKNIYPARSQLVCHAGIYQLIAVPQVKDAVDTALKSLESLSSVDRWRRVHTQPTGKARIDD